MLTVAVPLLVAAAICVVRSARTTDVSASLNQQFLDDFQKLLNKERGSISPHPMVYRYLWWDMPENYESVNRLVAKGYWREGFNFTNGKDNIWFDYSHAVGWTAYRKDSKGRQSSLWLPARFPQHFSTFLG